MGLISEVLKNCKFFSNLNFFIFFGVFDVFLKKFFENLVFFWDFAKRFLIIFFVFFFIIQNHFLYVLIIYKLVERQEF